MLDARAFASICADYSTSAVMMRVVLAVFLFCAAVYADEDYFRRLDALVPEEGCSRVGGICTFADDCENLADSGLCPNQRSHGVECCYGVSTRETRCSRNGGQCVTTPCNPRLVFDRATDCEDGEHCCVLV